MSHNNTVFSQILQFIPRHEFETLANRHHSGISLCKASRWSQFVAMAISQLLGRSSLRDMVYQLFPISLLNHSTHLPG